MHVRSDKIAELILSDARFASIYQLKYGHYIGLEEVDKHCKLAILMTLVVELDDVPITVEEIMNLKREDVLRISRYMG